MVVPTMEGRRREVGPSWYPRCSMGNGHTFSVVAAGEGVKAGAWDAIGPHVPPGDAEPSEEPRGDSSPAHQLLFVDKHSQSSKSTKKAPDPRGWTLERHNYLWIATPSIADWHLTATSYQMLSGLQTSYTHSATPTTYLIRLGAAGWAVVRRPLHSQGAAVLSHAGEWDRP